MNISKPGTKAFSADYVRVLKDIKTRIRTAQVKAALSANLEMIHLYWDIGRIIAERQKQVGWGAAVIPRLSRDIRNEIPEVKGFSERNIGYMIRFAQEYGQRVILQPSVANFAQGRKDAKSERDSILPLVVAKLPPQGKQAQTQDSVLPISTMALAKLEPAAILQPLVAKLPWTHNIILMEKVKDISVRGWYMQATLQEGWSSDVLALMIDSRTHKRKGKAITKGVDKAIGVSQYQLTRALPKEFRSSLPSIAEIESELSELSRRKPVKTSRPRRRS